MSSRLLRHLLIACACLTLAGCASRAAIAFIPDGDIAVQLEPVFLGTTRALTAEGFSNERAPGTRYAQYAISIPPQRELGSVQFAEGTPDPDTDFLVAGQQGFASAAAFQARLSETLAARPENSRDVFLYIHGYNNTFAQSLYRTAQMRFDYAVPGVATHFSWPSQADPRGYVFDSNSVLVARDELAKFIRLLAGTDHDNFLIMAHSMGAHLTMETLRALALEGDRATIDAIDAIALMSPDIDLDVFRTQARQIEPLPDPFVIFTSQNDGALRISSQIAGRVERVGNIDGASDLGEFNVTIVDVSEFDGGDGDGLNHMAAATSPALVQFVRRAAELNRDLESDGPLQAPTGLLAGTETTVQSARQVVLSPLQ